MRSIQTVKKPMSGGTPRKPRRSRPVLLTGEEESTGVATSKRRQPVAEVAVVAPTRIPTIPSLVPQPAQEAVAPIQQAVAESSKPKRRRVGYKQDTITNLIHANRRTVFPFPRIQHLLDELPVCRFQFTDSEAKLEQDDLVAALRHSSSTQRLQLPVFTSAFESQLMREAGSFRIAGRMVTFPACRFGDLCVGRATGPHAIPDLPAVTFMALLFEEELHTILDTGSVNLRGNRRPCILCYRNLLCDFLFSLQPRHAAPLGSTCIQIYSNLKACLRTAAHHYARCAI